jgi:hypothetical protein
MRWECALFERSRASGGRSASSYARQVHVVGQASPQAGPAGGLVVLTYAGERVDDDLLGAVWISRAQVGEGVEIAEDPVRRADRPRPSGLTVLLRQGYPVAF